ncbi:MAG: ABC transporter permease [Alphaproteobacteria bacterium]|nr:ABC transporter permease [Alphaproteobacteria bacterium]
MTQTENTVAPAITARDIKGINTVGLYTLVRREVSRFLIVYAQTIVTPVVSTLLFYTIFALAFGGLEKEIGGIPFLQFLAPGLIMMSMVQNSFSNTSSSLIIAKVQGNIVDILMPPLSSAELLLGFLIGGLARGLAVGAASVLVMSLFLSLPITSPGLIILFALLGNSLMAMLGIIGGVIAHKFDHLAAFTNFFVMPMTFLSGTFYSVESLPGYWKLVAHANPFFYMIDGFRSGFIGHADGSLAIGIALLVAVNVVLFAVTYIMLRTGYRIKS